MGKKSGSSKSINHYIRQSIESKEFDAVKSQSKQVSCFIPKKSPEKQSYTSLLKQNKSANIGQQANHLDNVQHLEGHVGGVGS